MRYATALAALLLAPSAQAAPTWLYTVAANTQAIGCFDQAHAYVLANRRAIPDFTSWAAFRAIQPVRFDEFLADGGCTYYDATTHWEELASSGHIAMMRLYPFTSWPQIIVFFEPQDLRDLKGNPPANGSPMVEQSPQYDAP